MVMNLRNLKVALITPDKWNDESYSFQAQEAAKKLQKTFGFELSISENLFTGRQAEPVAVEYARKGYDVIILHGLNYEAMAHKAAPSFPETMFLCTVCNKIGPPNVFNVWMVLEEGGFVMGTAAGRLTRSNVIGLVGGGRNPDIFLSSIWACHEAFKAGALHSNPRVKFHEEYARDWQDVVGARRAAENGVAAGADVVFSSGDGIDVGVMQVAKKHDVWASNVYSDLLSIQSDLKKQFLGSIVVSFDIPWSAALQAYVQGRWHHGFLTATMAAGIVKAQIGPEVPAKVRDFALGIQQRILFGSLKVYFDVNPKTGNYLLLEKPALARGRPTAANVVPQS